MVQRQLTIFVISILALIGIQQLVTYQLLKSQKEDGTVINYAGRQRMLSQNIAKNVLYIENREVANKDATEERRALRGLLKEFEKVHEGLKSRDAALKLGGENSELVQKMFKELEPSYNVVVNNAHQLILAQQVKDIQIYSSTILNNEQTFLNQMDAIVFQYDKEYRNKVEFMTSMIMFLTIITIATFLFEIAVLIYPMMKKARDKN